MGSRPMHRIYFIWCPCGFQGEKKRALPEAKTPYYLPGGDGLPSETEGWNLANCRPIHSKRRPPPFAMLFQPLDGPGTWQIAHRFMANGDRSLLPCFFGLWTGPGPGKSLTDSWQTATAPFCHAFSAPARAQNLANRPPIHGKSQAGLFARLSQGSA